MYPYVTIENNQRKCHVSIWYDEETVDILYSGKTDQGKLKTVLTPILHRYPNIRVRSDSSTTLGYLHIFRINKEGGTIRAFVKTHSECDNPFKNRKTYAMVNPDATVGFDSVQI